MKKLIFTAAAILSLTACAAIPMKTTQYRGKTFRGGDMTLTLDPDRSFEASWLNTDYTGKWETLDEKNFLLKFDEITDPAIFLQAWTIDGSTWDAKFINKNRIKTEYNIILKRVR